MAGRPGARPRVPEVRQGQDPVGSAPGVHHALRHVQPTDRLRHGAAPPHVPLRHHRRADGPRGRDDESPRGAQPPGGDGATAHDDGRLPGRRGSCRSRSASSTAVSRTTAPVPWSSPPPSVPPTWPRTPVAVLGRRPGNAAGLRPRPVLQRGDARRRLHAAPGPGPSPTGSGPAPDWGPATSTWPRSTTTSPGSSCSAWRTSASAGAARAGPSPRRGRWPGPTGRCPPTPTAAACPRPTSTV